MPKLLQITVGLGQSIGKIAQQIGEAAIEYGWDSWIAYAGRSDSSPSQLKTIKSKVIKVGNYFDACVHYALQRIFDSEGLHSIFYTLKLIKQIKELRPDVIQLHDIHDHWLNYKILFEYLNTTNIPVVWTFHDFWPITGHCMHFTKVKCNKWEKLCNNCPMKSFYPRSILDNSKSNYQLKQKLFQANKNLHIVAVSDWVQSIAVRSFLSDKDIRVIYNGVDLNVFYPRTIDLKKYNINERDFIILGVSTQWEFEKGFEDFLSLSNCLKSDERIVLVGVSDKIRSILPKNIIGIPKTQDVKELACLYTRADVLVSFSPAETFGMTIVEAMACGTPSVVYNNTAQPSVISKETGIVVPNGDFSAAYSAIQAIKRNGKEQYYSECIERVRIKFDKDVCFKKYINLYSSIINEI